MNIEELKESVYHTDITRDEICEIIDQAVEITKREREWVSVDDRLPPENKYVLINVMMIAMYDREYKQWDDGDYYHDIEDVTHWMLLPESPKEV